MQALPRRAGLGVLALLLAMPALAQENIDAGKTPAQLYAKDCAICHKTPHGLARAGGMAGLQRFLREHYTTSRESAAALAAYLVSVDRAAPPRGRAAKQGAKKEAAKMHEEKPKKAGEAKPADKAAEKPAARPEEAKAEGKPETKKPEANSGSQPHAADAKPDAKTDAKADAAKAGADAKPEKKPD